MTDDPVVAAARAAVGHLATRHSPTLEAEVESALHTRGSERQPDQYFDPVSLGSLIVSIASLTWSIYIGLKQKTLNPTPDVLARAVRVELRTPGDATASQNEVTDVVVTEIIRAAGDQG